MSDSANTPNPMKDVPRARVGQVVQNFLDYDGVTDLEVELQDDGKFLVTPLG